MKNKGRLLGLGFVTCCLLIVLLYACEDGYLPETLSSIKFYYKEIAIDEDGDDVLDDNGNEVYKNIEITEANPFIVDNTPKLLYIEIDTPSSIKVTYTKVNSTELTVSEVNSDNSKPRLLVLTFNVSTEESTPASYFIKVTVQPGGVDAICPVKKL